VSGWERNEEDWLLEDIRETARPWPRTLILRWLRLVEGCLLRGQSYPVPGHCCVQVAAAAKACRAPGRRGLDDVSGCGERNARAYLEARHLWHDPDRPWVAWEHPAPIDNDDGNLFELPGPLTHADVVDRARRWLLGKHECRVAFAEIVTYERVNPDAIGFRKAGGAVSSWSVLVEAKVSRSDFRADREKPIHRDPDSCSGQERWYLTPPNLIRPAEVPAGWGLAEVGKRSIRVVVPAPIGEFSVRRAHADFGILLAALHRHQIGVEWLHEIGKFRPYGSLGAK